MPISPRHNNANKVDHQQSDNSLIIPFTDDHALAPIVIFVFSIIRDGDSLVSFQLHFQEGSL